MLRKFILVFGSLVLGACSTEPIRNLENNNFGAPENVNMTQIELAILRAAKSERWTLRRLKPGAIEATYSIRQHRAVVDILYDKEKFSIVYKDSINLKYDGKEISKHYAIWINQLRWKIQRYSSSIIYEDQAPAFAGKRSGPPKKSGTGSGFFISSAGHVLTNDHVVKQCFEIYVANHGKADLVGKDEKFDLALLKVAKGGPGVAKFRDGADIRLGEDIVTAGFPLQGLLGGGLNISTGTVSALSGLGGNPKQLQMSAPVQPGSSGGPLLDRAGNVVGVVVAKLNAIAVAQVTRDIPQNVNFAVNLSAVKPFLKSQGVPYQAVSSTKKVQVADVADTAKSFTVSIECWK